MKLYQNVDIKGESITYEDRKRADSRFWNEGKWHTFIRPLLPIDCTDMTFVEIGCNAGLFLRMATEHGFRHVVGIESNPVNVEYATKYRGQFGYGYKVLRRTVGVDFDFDELPVADVTLLSNVHYYFDIQTWLQYLDELRHKTQYAIVVSRRIRSRKDWTPSPGYTDLRVYFRDWSEAGAVHDHHGKDMEGDPSPRRMWSLLFESGLRRRPMADFEVDVYTKVGSTFRDLVHQVLSGVESDVRETAYYQRWLERKAGEWTEQETFDFVMRKVNLIKDVAANGLRYPIVAQLYRRIADGRTRYGILKELGYSSVMTRVL